MVTASKIVEKAREVRKAQKAYYAYKPRTTADIQTKSDLLNASKGLERELDQMILDHDKKQADLFPAN